MLKNISDQARPGTCECGHWLFAPAAFVRGGQLYICRNHSNSRVTVERRG